METRTLVIDEVEVPIPATMTQDEALSLASSTNPEFATGQIRVGQVGQAETWTVERVSGSKG